MLHDLVRPGPVVDVPLDVSSWSAGEFMKLSGFGVRALLPMLHMAAAFCSRSAPRAVAAYSVSARDARMVLAGSETSSRYHVGSRRVDEASRSGLRFSSPSCRGRNAQTKESRTKARTRTDTWDGTDTPSQSPRAVTERAG